MSPKWSQRSVYDELPELMRERGIRMTAMAHQLEVTPGHLSRALRRAEYKGLSTRLITAAAQALDLPEDYWPEVRQARVVDALTADPALRDRLYRRYGPRER